MLSGCITAIVTPMLSNGEVDYSTLDELVEWQIASGVDGLVAVGSTGEAATLLENEKLLVVKQIIAKAAGRVKIIVGSGTASTAQTLAFIEQVNAIIGIDYLMCLTPYYVKPTQEGLYQHFAAVAKCSIVPVVLYNVPGRTGCNLLDTTILRLARDFPQIIGLKDATGDISRCLNLVSQKPANFSLLSGDDGSALAFMLSGGNGVISVASNIRPTQMSQLCTLALSGERDAALAINAKLLRLYEDLFCEANPIPVKWGLFHEGKIRSAVLRLPLTELSLAGQTKLSQALAQAN